MWIVLILVLIGCVGLICYRTWTSLKRNQVSRSTLLTRYVPPVLASIISGYACIQPPFFFQVPFQELLYGMFHNRVYLDESNNMRINKWMEDVVIENPFQTPPHVRHANWKSEYDHEITLLHVHQRRNGQAWSSVRKSHRTHSRRIDYNHSIFVESDVGMHHYQCSLHGRFLCKVSYYYPFGFISATVISLYNIEQSEPILLASETVSGRCTAACDFDEEEKHVLFAIRSRHDLRFIYLNAYSKTTELNWWIIPDEDIFPPGMEKLSLISVDSWRNTVILYDTYFTEKCVFLRGEKKDEVGFCVIQL